MRTCIITAVFVLTGVYISVAQNNNFDSLVSAGIKQIYNIKFENAEKTFSVVAEKYPLHPAGKFFDAMIVWWKIMLDMDNESYDDTFEDKLDEVIDFCDDLLDKNPDNVDAVFFKGGTIGFRGRLEALRENWLSAGLDGKDALPLVYRAYEIDPKNVDVQLGFGIYNYYAAVIPEEYPAVKPLMIFFPSGDKEKGIEQLINVAYNGKYAVVEAKYFLMTLFYRYEKKYDNALKYGKMLVREFPDNPRFQRYYGRIIVSQGDYTSSTIVFKDILRKCKKKYRGYNSEIEREADYYIATDFQNKNQIDSALAYFSNCRKISMLIDTDEESGFLINSTLFIGMLLDQSGKSDEAKKYYEEVLDYREYGASHDLAERYIENPYGK